MGFHFHSRIRSFVHAFRGVFTLLRGEPNFIIQSVIAMVVIIAAIIFPVTVFEWIVLLMLIALVLSAEAFNTAMEKMCDLLQEKTSSRVRFIKDVSAGAVLLLALFSAVIGIAIFWKYIAALF